MTPRETDMGTDSPTRAGSTSRYAVPVADLDSVHVSEAQMVALTSSSHRMPDPAWASMLAVPDADGDGD